MKIDSTPMYVKFMLPHGISFDERELSFLKEMCKFCILNQMPGWAACENLFKFLDQLGIQDSKGPVYGIFEKA